MEGGIQENTWVQIFWLACVATAIVASVLAIWSRRARYVGRVAVGVLMLVGGATFNAANLALGQTYADFADQAHFGWVTGAWRAVVAPNHYLFIGLLVAFEAIVGVLILSGDGGPRSASLARSVSILRCGSSVGALPSTRF
jgi:hypothetical protein